MFEEADNFADLFRGGIPYYLLITLPILILISSNPVLASSEFSIQRMSQFDVHGVSYGCRASNLNLEAKSLNSWKTSRHCVVARFQDMTVDQYREIRAKAGGLIMLLPTDLTNCSVEEKQRMYLLEQAMMNQEISIPVFFSKFNEEFSQIVDDISIDSKNKDLNKQQQRDSAISEIINSVSANGYQIVVTGSNHAANKQSKIPIIQGELAPVKNIKYAENSQMINVEANNKLPLIVITAHMDTFGLVNEQLSNVDLAVFHSIIDIFSKIHNSASTAPKYRIMFILSESGVLLNFQGTKKWLETNVDENTQSQFAEFVLCIDAIGHNALEDNIYMHVSKPPKEGSQMNNFYKHLKRSAQLYGNISVEGVHKRINLADVQLAWEHERFSMRRMPSFTLSSLKSHKDPLRTSIFSVSDEETLKITQRNVKIIAEALGAYIYSGGNPPSEIDSITTPNNNNQNNHNVALGELFKGSTAIDEQLVRPWLNVRSTLLNNDIKNAFEKYLRNVKISFDKPDARDPDFMLYDGHEGVLNIYSVKPAVFDLFLTFAIVAYLTSVYFFILYFPDIYTAISRLNGNNNNNNTNNKKDN